MYTSKKLREICNKQYDDYYGFLYIMSSLKHDNVYKIGYTHNLNQRIQELKSSQAIDKCLYNCKTRYVKRSEAIVKHLLHPYNIGYYHTTMHREWFLCPNKYLKQIMMQIVHLTNKYDKKNKKILYHKITENKKIINLQMKCKYNQRYILTSRKFNLYAFQKLCNKHGYKIVKKNN
ncbi:hypothetical protein BMW23_0116 [Bodo saltans virus]|uniref:Bacteriophage T5 Orf172 DNA-binding domain-containing protein n=1 Tax=Bodo saltans virus TaxID=2024608 RepID=A0A2H4UTK1_9VIRU|nr:hypothetical protein QJ851_gp0113 [Bodo saltans virus]ATZ80176.1 hypothetical protein BMW23_0116 [Bodo saltans virus]